MTCATGNTLTIVDGAGDVGRESSIAIGADGLPVLSYSDDTNGTLKVAHCGNATCTASNTLTTVDSAEQNTSIAIGADGLPVVSYGDATNTSLKVAHCGNVTCTAGNTLTTVDSAVFVSSSITIGTDGLPVVSYGEGALIDLDLKVAHCGNVTCTAGNTLTTVDSAANGFGWVSIAIGADGLPVVSYWDDLTEDLKVAHCGNVTCTAGGTVTTVDSAGEVGFYSSIAIGADGLPVVSYLGLGTGGFPNLKVAHCGDPVSCK